MKNAVLFSMLWILVMGANASGETTLKTYYQDSAPKYFLKDGKVVGVCADIINELNARLKKKEIRIAPVHEDFVPVERRVRDLQEGRIDVFVGMSRRKDGEQHYRYADQPIYQLKGVFAKLASDPFEYTDRTVLKGKKIASLKASSSAKRIFAVDGVVGMPVYDIPTGLKLLTNRRVDLVYYHNLGLGFNIKEYGFKDEVTLAENAFREKGHYVVFNKDVSPGVIDEVNKTLTAMYEDGTLMKIADAYR